MILYIKTQDGSNRPFTKKEWAEYRAIIDEQEKREYLHFLAAIRRMSANFASLL